MFAVQYVDTTGPMGANLNANTKQNLLLNKKASLWRRSGFDVRVAGTLNIAKGFQSGYNNATKGYEHPWGVFALASQSTHVMAMWLLRPAISKRLDDVERWAD